MASPPEQAHHNAKTTAKATKGICKSQKSRAGVPNYGDADISALLDFVAEVEPLGSNHWALVPHKFGEWARAKSRPERAQDSLKNKFDKLANAKKKTEDPSCPANVRRAKHIARDIHAKCAALTLDGDSSDEGNEIGSEATPESSEAPTDKSSVGEYKDKRKTAATGTPSKVKAKSEEVLLGHIGDTAEHIGNMSKEMTASQKSITTEEVIKIVKVEVKESMRPTNELLAQMHSMLQSITSQTQQ